MLFALLGGQVDQKTPSPNPHQGLLTQTPLHDSPQITLNPIPGGIGDPFRSLAWQMSNPPPFPMGSHYMEADRSVEDLSATELWGRLQTFYEPSPAYWSQNGFVDFQSALGSMGMS